MLRPFPRARHQLIHREVRDGGVADGKDLVPRFGLRRWLCQGSHGQRHPKKPAAVPHSAPRALALGSSFGGVGESANSKPERYASFRTFVIFSKLIFSTVSVIW